MDIQQPAYVLHSRPYKETSALVTFFTPQQGKVSGVVRGVRGGRKTTSQKAAAIQPFQKLLIQWREKPQLPQDLVSIREFEAVDIRFPLQSDANICGLYLNELLYRLLYLRVATESLFDAYEHALYALLKSSDNRAKQAWALRQFEAKLLAELGQPVLLTLDHQQTPIKAENQYRYFIELGPVLETAGDDISSDMSANFNDKHYSSGAVLRISGKALLALAEDDYCAECLPELKTLFRKLLADVLGNQPIKTRELFS